jgi:hypothetical protein
MEKLNPLKQAAKKKEKGFEAQHSAERESEKTQEERRPRQDVSRDFYELSSERSYLLLHRGHGFIP